MKKLFFLIAMLCILDANAQNYRITFEGTGASTTVSTVQVENITTGLFLTLNGSDILHLGLSTGINSGEDRQSGEMKIYPNPVTDNAIIQFNPKEEGNAEITLFDMTGQKISHIRSYLSNSVQEFRLSGLKSGFYLISVKGNNYQYSGKLLCNSKADANVSIEKLSNNKATYEKVTQTDLKGGQAIVNMAYANGDRLKFTGTSGNYTTVLTDIPLSDKTIIFNFVDCTDGDGNEYPVIVTPKDERKGVTQIWMAVNLRSKTYNDGSVIPLVTDDNMWSNLKSPGCCWYNNSESGNKTTYGALYNWYTVNTGKLCPAGWHVPGNDEWSVFMDFLGGEKSAAGKLKETGTTRWRSPNTGATNEIGFTALPAGYRYSDGTFIGTTGNSNWWSATAYDEPTAWYRYIYHYSTEVFNSHQSKATGFSVRCVKN